MDGAMNTDRILGALIGLLTGMFLCCLSTGILLALNTGTPAASPPLAGSPPVNATIDVAIDEAYLSRTMAANARGFPSPLPIVGGRMDVQPGNQATFDALLGSPVGRLLVSGRLTFAVERGQLAIHIVEARLGAITVTPLMGLFAPNIDAQINAQANQMLQERTKGAGVTLLSVATDDQFLRFYLTGQ